MVLLGPDDPLPRLPRRIAVAGVSGAGKTTLAGRIGAALGIEPVEIDALFHGPGWTPRPEFRTDVEAFVAHHTWVTEWQYRSARPLLTARIDLLVWLDLPTAVVLRQVVARTVTRRLRREELWNGNVEGPLTDVFRDSEHILRWAWRTRHKYRGLGDRMSSERPALALVRLRSHAEADRWLGTLAAAATADDGAAD